MAFSHQLEGFAKAFATGYDMTRSREERAIDKAKRKKAEWETSDEALDRAARLEEVDIGYKGAEAARIAEATKVLERANTPEAIADAKRDLDSLIASREAQTGLQTAQTGVAEDALERSRSITKRIKDSLANAKRRRGGTAEGEAGAEAGGTAAVPTGEDAAAAAGFAPVEPGSEPLSPAPAPAVDTGTYSPAEVQAPATLNPQGVAEAVPIEGGVDPNSGVFVPAAVSQLQPHEAAFLAAISPGESGG